MMQEMQPELMFILLGLRYQIFFQFEFRLYRGWEFYVM